MTTTENLPEYVEDGRPCQLVKVSELLPGDEILGWYGEPWTFGTVERVEREPRQSYGAGPIQYTFTVFYADDTPANYWNDGDGWRRIAARDGAS